MPEQTLTNPLAAYSKSADLTTYLNANGSMLDLGQSYGFWRANEALTKWAAVALVAATATVPPSVELLDVSDAYAQTLFIGVAQDACVAGGIVKVCKAGLTLVQIDTDDPITGSVANKGAGDGQLGAVLIGSLDNTVVVGDIFGAYLDVENASDIAPVYLWGRG